MVFQKIDRIHSNKLTQSGKLVIIGTVGCKSVGWGEDFIVPTSFKIQGVKAGRRSFHLLSWGRAADLPDHIKARGAGGEC